MHFPKRYLTDGTATTRRVVHVELESSRTPTVYRVLTAWAGSTTPEDQGWRATVAADGSVTLSGLPDRETPAMRAGIIRRVKNAEGE